MYSEKTIYNYIDACLLDVRNIDLPRKVNFIEPQKTKLKPRPKTPGNALKRNIKPSVRKNQPKIQYDTNFKNKEWENNKRNKK